MKLSIKDIDLKDKKVLIRVDFNVPVDKELNITDDARIRKAIPTIKYALENGAKLILMSHMGRPKGQVVEDMRLNPAKEKLQELLGINVKKANDCIGEEVESAVAELQAGEVLLLENLRFYKQETDNDEDFAKKLASLGEIYINDAFGTAHRAHASTEGVTKFIDICASGFLMQKELEYFDKILLNPDRPFVAILGGAKVSDKITVIENLMDKVDTLIIGGGMAYTFLKAKGFEIGSSLLEEDRLEVAKNIIKKADEKGIKLLLPCDHMIADKFDKDANTEITIDENIKQDWMALDIGPKTREFFTQEIKNSKTVIWNGPVGVFEMDKFQEGTKTLAVVLAETELTSVIGGGDTAAAVVKFDVEDKMSHVSTGGGASLELMEGKVLPGIAALTDK
jgi:phosphoglycerate kinase